VLDIAAGTVSSASLAARTRASVRPRWANVLTVVRRTRVPGVADRFRTVRGALQVDYGPDYDLVLLANFCTLRREACFRSSGRSTGAPAGGRDREMIPTRMG